MAPPNVRRRASRACRRSSTAGPPPRRSSMKASLPTTLCRPRRPTLRAIHRDSGGWSCSSPPRRPTRVPQRPRPIAQRCPARRSADARQTPVTTRDCRHERPSPRQPPRRASRNELPIDALDPTPFAIDDFEQELDVFIANMTGRLTALLKEIDKRIIAADNATAGSRRDLRSSRARRGAAAGRRRMLGEEVRLIPDITFNADRAAELPPHTPRARAARSRTI